MLSLHLKVRGVKKKNKKEEEEEEEKIKKNPSEDPCYCKGCVCKNKKKKLAFDQLGPDPPSTLGFFYTYFDKFFYNGH